MDFNPYQSPAASFDATPAESLRLPRVDGECLVVTSGMVLPLVCVKTNQPVSERDLVRRRFEWCTPWVAILILAGLLPVLLAYLLLRKKCFLTFGVHPDVRRKHRKRILLKIAAVVVLFLAIPLSACIDAIIVSIVAVVLFLAAVVSLFFGHLRMGAVKYRKGMFWIKGFSAEFLARFEPL